jgi:acylglycerol lipase
MQNKIPGLSQNDVAAPNAVVILIHGMGAHQGRWASLMEFLRGKNIRAYGFDLRGFGSDTGIKGHVGSFKEYYESIDAVLTLAKGQNPGKKIFLLGESMGGLIAFCHVAKHAGADGLILISPAFGSRMNIPPSQMLTMILSLFTAPKRQFVMPFDSKMITSDPEMQKILDSDTLEHRLATPKLLINIIIEQVKSIYYARTIRVPVLFLLAGDSMDLLVDPKASKKIFAALHHKFRDQLKQYQGMLHALSIEKDRDIVFADLADWLIKQAGAARQ